MPNWCMNYLTITGETKNLKRFVKEASKKGSFMIAHAPLEEAPETELATLDTLLQGHPLFDQISAWGSKWPDSEIDFESIYQTIHKGCRSIGFSFDTAWAPPLTAIERISKKFKDTFFTISWDEPGIGFHGCATYLYGKPLIIFDESYPEYEFDNHSDEEYEEYRDLINIILSENESQAEQLAIVANDLMTWADKDKKFLPRDSFLCPKCLGISPIEHIFHTANPLSPCCKNCETVAPFFES